MKLHESNTCPVPNMAKVIYRTTDDEGRISHVHMPVLAHEIVWNYAPKIGRIYDYKVIG